MPSGLRTWAAIAALSLAGPAAGAAQPALPNAESWQPALLERWLTAVAQHQPGTIDVPLIDATTWTRADLRQLWVDVQVLWEFVEQSKKVATSLRVRPLYPTAQAAWVDVRLGVSGRKSLVELSDRVRRLGVAASLRRAVMVHTDVATLAADRITTDDEPVPVGATMRMIVGDGQAAGSESVSLHWDLTRLLIERLVRTAPDDRWPRDWYRATIGLSQRIEAFDSNHLRHALRVIPNDAWLRVLEGCHHEAMSAPLFQEFARPFRGTRLKPDLESEKDELVAAEKAFRHALRLDPSMGEARVRLGRVLGRQGRHAESIDELTRALAERLDPVVQYFATLFLALEHEALDDAPAATTAYVRASTLRPDAPLPQLALARLAQSRGDR